jgi:hypothetical protein
MATRLSSGLSFSTLRRALNSPDKDLSASESESTLFRFFRSKHVFDLKLIVTLALVTLFTHIFVVLLFGAIDALKTISAPAAPPSGAAATAATASSALVATGPKSSLGVALIEYFKFSLQYIGPAIPIYGAIIAWSYLTASARLGIVDLFACEISTLCRVGTIFEIGKSSVDQFYVENFAGSASFVSQEEYFPVFDNNARDLQVLEASVVDNITEFYTYTKAMRDSRRKLAQIKPLKAAKPGVVAGRGQIETDQWHITVCNVILVLFLAFESGRRAVNDLVEFQPTKAERTIVILLTELRCYSFLLDYFHKYFGEDDLRYRRLKLREPDYKQEVVPKLYCKVMEVHGGNEKMACPVDLGDGDNGSSCRFEGRRA